jgi:transcriptional regulator with XRE-family HTH domain
MMNDIRNLRTELGLSQQQLADLLGVSRSLLSLAELGRRQLTPSALLRLTELVASMRRDGGKEIEEAEMDPSVNMRLETLRNEQEAERAQRRNEMLSLRDRLQRRLAEKEARYQKSAMAIHQMRSEMLLLEDLVIVTDTLTTQLSRAMKTWEMNHPVHCRPLVWRIAELNALLTLLNTPGK